MKKESKQGLIQRWYTDEGVDKRNKIMDCLKNNISLDELQFIEKHDSRYDLRGIVFDLRMNIKNAKLENIDLSYAELERLILTDCSIRNTLFYMSNCTQLTQFRCRFDDCQFIKSKLNVAGFGINGGQYNNIVFDGCNFNSAGFAYPDFNDCIFKNCNLTRVDFGGSYLNNVKFIGKLSDVWFRGNKLFSNGLTDDDKRNNGINPMIVDFAEAYLWYTTISDFCDLSKVILPKDEKHYLITDVNKVVQYLRIKLENEKEQGIKKFLDVFIAVIQRPNNSQNMNIINIDQLVYMAQKRMNKSVDEYCTCMIKEILEVCNS